MKNFTESIKGFTLLETLLSISIIIILAGISVPLYQSFQVRNDLDIAANVVSQSLRRVQLLSQAVNGDSSWGLYVHAQTITIFKGDSYATRTIEDDEVFEIPTGIVTAGISEVVYSKFFGLPLSTGDIILTSSINETKTITINHKGTLSY